MIDRLKAVCYIAPLREGGSLPAIVETEPAGQYVVKFRGAGQGAKALIAELISAGLGKAIGLPIPAAALVFLEAGFGRGEPDPEIQDLLRGSVGENFGLAYLPGSFGFDAAIDLARFNPELAANVVWFDAFLTNPDRTVRNPNILRWNNQMWLIDHGAALYFHHRWQGWETRANAGFPLVKDHVLLRRAGDLIRSDTELRSRLTTEVIQQTVADIPTEWLVGEPNFADANTHREAYISYLTTRLTGSRPWLQQAIDARRAI